MKKLPHDFKLCFEYVGGLLALEAPAPPIGSEALEGILDEVCCELLCCL